MRLRRFSIAARPAWALLAASVLIGTSVAAADPVVGFREDWAGTSTNGWGGGGGGGATYSNPGTDGVDGPGDGFLLITQADPGPFGSRSAGAEYTGDWLAAGIDRVRVSLNDVGAPDAFEIHVCIGNQSNFWIYKPGFTPPNGAWQEFTVDLSDESQWAQIIGAGTFAQALQFADRLLIRYDRAPFIQTPDPGSGDLGIDRVILTAVPTRTRLTTWGQIKRLYR